MFHVVTSPVRFFRARVETDPRWVPAFAPVAAYCVFVSSAAVVSGRRGQAALEAALAGIGGGSARGGAFMVASLVVGVVAAIVFTFALFALHAGAAVLLDVLFARSARARRLVEFTAYAYLPQAAWAAAVLVVLAGWWTPEPLRAPPSLPGEDLSRLVADYQSSLASAPLQITLRTVGLFFGLWLAALQAAALRVVSGFTTRGAVASGFVLALVFVVVPWVLWN